MNRDVLQVADEFRQSASPILGPPWVEALTRAPLTKDAVKTLLKMRQTGDEFLVIRMLTETGSESAQIIAAEMGRLELTREIVPAPMSILASNHSVAPGLNFTFSVF